MTVSLTKFGHNTEYRVPPEGAGARVSHNQFFYGKITSLSNEFRTPARFSCGSSGVAGTISEYYEFEDGYRIVMVLNDDSDSDFNTPESVTIVSTTGTETAQLDAWEKIIVSDISIIDPLNPENHLSIDNLGSASIRFAEGQPILSGFGSLKTAEEVAIGVYESSIDSYETLFHKFISGGGSFLYSANQSSHILSTDTSSGSSIRMTTNRSHYYLPGTSNVYKMTMSCGDTGKTGNLRRWGAFDENDGVFFELYENTLNVVLRSSATGSAVETKVPSNLWNGDRLDGSGLSGYTLDVTKINVWWMDFQWLGAGRVRFGIFSPEGARVVCHTFQNAGNRALPYMRTGTLPASVENTNFGATGSSSELRNVCIGVYSEGDVLKSYTFWRYSTGILSKTVSTPQTLIAAYRAVATVKRKKKLSTNLSRNFKRLLYCPSWDYFISDGRL